MGRRKLHAVQSEKQIRTRLISMLNQHSPSSAKLKQAKLFSKRLHHECDERFQIPSHSVTEFLNFLCDALPGGNVYLFGGVLRDLAMFGRKGFSSDIDLVVDGDWTHLRHYLKELDASVTRFGGFRLMVDGWPVDLWAAKDTWAIQQGLVQYSSILSLTRTTILNWDAVLFNWSTKRVLCKRDYFAQIYSRTMDIVLPENPNPLRAAVRAFRHLCMNDAREITVKAARYLGDAAQRYSKNTIVESEDLNYNNRVIDPAVIQFFGDLDVSSDDSIKLHFSKVPKEKKFDGTNNVYQPRLI